MRRCCVAGCSDKTSRRFSIPAEDRIKVIWIERIGNPGLLQFDTPHLQKNFPVCANHFDPVCMNPGRLLRYALPTLNLPGVHDGCFSYPTEQYKYGTPKKVKDMLQPVSSSSTTLSSPETLAVNIPTKVYPGTTKRIRTSLFGASVSSECMDTHPQTQPSTSRSSPINNPEPDEVPVQSYSETPKRQKRLLQSVGVTRQCQLSPKARFLYKKVKTLQQTAARLSNQKLSVQKKLKFLMSKGLLFNYFKKVNSVTANFLLSQLRTQKYKPRGRRFTVDDKILALSIYKQSGKAYRFLSKIFSLPSRKVLASLLNKVPFLCGINESIFSHLRNRVSKMKEVHKHCVLMFDEVSLTPGLQYNPKTDSIDGFVDFGSTERRLRFADHALTFIVKGIYRKWKQTVCFTFCEGTTPTAELSRILKTVIRQLTGCGLNIVATISDQGATNQAVINQLLADTNRHFNEQNETNTIQGYLIDGKEIIHMYDFPHLIKCIRNMLLTKDLHFVQEGIRKVASWSHVVRLYEIDRNRGGYSQFTKLTDEHVLPNKIKKMKVKNCTQVFSHTVGTAMHVAAEVSQQLLPTSEFYLDPKAIHTPDLLLFFDLLFDSVNGSSRFPPPGKNLRCAVSRKTNHISFWQLCLPILSSMYFKGSQSNAQTKPPSLKNWIFSLRGLIYLAPKLLQTGFVYFSPRCFNQDPVENFFSCIRSHGVRNVNPTCSSFSSSCKSLLVNNFVSTHSAGANCEQDECEGSLDNLRFFLEQPNMSYIAPEIKPLPVSDTVSVAPNILGNYTSSYVAGYVGKKLLKNCACDLCKKKMCSNVELAEHALIIKRQYQGFKLIHPSSYFSNVFRCTTQTLLKEIPKYIICYNIKKKLKAICLKELSDNGVELFCPQHQSCIDYYAQVCVNLVLHSFISTINKTLLGKDVRFVKQNLIVELAYKKFLKRHKK